MLHQVHPQGTMNIRTNLCIQKTSSYSVLILENFDLLVALEEKSGDAKVISFRPLGIMSVCAIFP